MARCHCNNPSIISMLIGLFVVVFFRFFLSLFDGSMSFSYPFKGAILTWMEYRITLPVSLCSHLFVKHSLLCDHVCASREKC